MAAKLHAFNLLLILATALGCSDSNEPTTAPQTETTARAQAVVEPGEPNWLVAGQNGLVEMVGGADGEPDALTGRFVMDGLPIVSASSASDRWIVVGDGKIQAVDADALRIREVRDALGGNAIATIQPGPVGWLIGGASGEVQLLDAEGEPTQTVASQLLQNDTITGAAWNGNSWLLGSSSGRVTTASATLTTGSPNGVVAFSGTAVVDVVTGSAPVSGQSTDWFVFSSDSVVRVTGGGTPQGATLIEAGLEITTAKFILSKVVLGSNDGRVGVFNPTNSSVTWNTVFTGEGVSAIETDGTDLLVLGNSGSVRLLDNNAVPKAPAASLATDRTPAGAWFVNGRWLVVIGDVAFVEFIGADLMPLRVLQPVLDGADIRASDAADGGVLVAGAQGKVQLLDKLGSPLGAVQTIGTGNADMNAVSWSGDNFLVVGDGGVAQLVGNDGALVGTPLNLLDGSDLHFAAWSGEYWLVGGQGGKYARIRTDGQVSGAVNTLAGATSVDAARFGGQAWMMAGTNGTNALFALVQPDGTTGNVTTLNSFEGTVNAVEFNGLEWLLGGTAGTIQRLSAEGQVVGTPSDVLNSYDIRDIYFNGVNYLVTGQFGAIRRLSADAAGLRAPIATLNLRDANTTVWTRPRGFAGGICLSNDRCYEGPCVGGVLEGKCCDSPCDRACESCFQQDTGEADGVCAPVVAGKQPPSGANGCARASESTCGYTGACDGQGECQFYGADISCGEPACVAGAFTADASCDGAGACAIPAAVDCRPYAGCTPDGGCATGCGSNSDCVSGFECIDGACVQPDDTTNEPKPGDTSEDDGGCCATVTHRPNHKNLWLIAALFSLGLVVRRIQR
ncbi:MAG: hypothetical protein R3E66_00595 [bacterium]